MPNGATLHHDELGVRTRRRPSRIEEHHIDPSSGHAGTVDAADQPDRSRCVLSGRCGSLCVAISGPVSYPGDVQRERVALRAGATTRRWLHGGAGGGRPGDGGPLGARTGRGSGGAVLVPRRGRRHHRRLGTPSRPRSPAIAGGRRVPPARHLPPVLGGRAPPTVLRARLRLHVQNTSGPARRPGPSPRLRPPAGPRRDHLDQPSSGQHPDGPVPAAVRREPTVGSSST